MPNFTKPSSPALQSGNAFASGLLRCFAMNQGSGSTILDYSTNAANLTTRTALATANATWGTDATYGGYASFNGTNQDAWGVDTGLVTGQGAQTIAVLFNSALSPPDYARVLLGYGTNGSSLLGATLSSPNYNTFQYQAWGATTLTYGAFGTANNADSAWHLAHIVMSGTGTATLYIDGVNLPASTTGTGGAASIAFASTIALSGKLYLGQFGGTGGSNSDGTRGAWANAKIAGAWMWNRAFTSGNVASHYADPWALVRPMVPTLVSLAGASSGFVSVPVTITASLDFPATGSTPIALASSNGSDTIAGSPATLSTGASSGTLTYTPATAGARTLTGSSAGLTSGTLAFTANAQTLSASPAIITPGVATTVTLAGGGTHWQSAPPTFSGSGLTVTNVVVASDTAATARVTASAGSYTLADSTTGATVAITAAYLYSYLGVFDIGATGVATARARVLRPDGTTYAAWGTAGVTELGSGLYQVSLQLPLSPLLVEFDDGAGGLMIADVWNLAPVIGAVLAATPVTLPTTAPANWINTAAFAAGATVPHVTLVDTLTTYTGNTPQTGDSFARDIFTTTLPGSYASGSAGNIIGGILDSVVSTKGTVLASPSPTRTAFSATIPTTVSDTVLQAGSTIKFLSGPNAFAFLPILTATRTGTSTTVALTFASPGFLAAPGTDSFVIY